jgi:hypothetical protein
MTDLDFIAENWWATVSGAGTDSAAVESWADDYTRHRSGDPTWGAGDGTASGIEWNKHSSTNQPTDLYYGRTKTGRELDKGKI